jgi:predicted N-acetyltransferase YhbS
MSHEIDHLYAHYDHLPRIARMIYEEFWVGTDGYTLTELEARLADATSPDRIPLSLVALVDGRPAGTANLIDNDDAARPHLHPWLAALVVLPEHRGLGIGSDLVARLLREAERLGYPEVFLGTGTPRFYARFGAEIIDQARENLFVMRCPTASCGPPGDPEGGGGSS